MIDYKKIRVLLADGQDRQVLPMARAFKKLGCEVTTFNCSKLDNGYSSKYPDYKIVDTKVKDNIQYLVEMIEKLLQTGNYDLVIATSDLTAEALSINKERLEKYAKVAVVEPETFYISYDKMNTMKICMENGIPCPKTLMNILSIDDVLAANLSYPIVVKPRKSYGAIGFQRMDTKEKLIEFLSRDDCDLSTLIVQEYIPQADIQYEAAMFIDNNNNVKSALVFSKNRWFPVEGGSSTLNVTVDRPDIIETCTKLLQLIGWRGCADIDLIQDPRDGIAKIMEINPRVSGSVKICFEAGINLAQQIIEAAYGEEVTSYYDYKKDVCLRCMHTDLLWFIKSKDRFRTKPSWFSFKNTKDQIFSISDPLPGFTFTIQAFLKYRKEMKKRARLR
jgi:D-aspartate ligase